MILSSKKYMITLPIHMVQLTFRTLNSKNKYLNVSAKTLKRTLKQLKDNRADIEKIKFVSKLTRSKISKGCARNDQDLQTELEIKFKKNFWQTCKSIFNTATSSLPTFTKNQCVQYFLQVLSQARSKAYVIPDWIPELYLLQCMHSTTLAHRTKK